MLHSQQFFHWYYKDKFQRPIERSLSQWLFSETFANLVFCQLIRSGNMNSLTLEMIESLHTILGKAEKNFLLIGDKKGVSVGDDSLWLFSNPRSISKYCGLKARCEMRLKEINSVCVIQGNCMGSAAGLCLSCKFRVATNSSILGLPENSLGGVPDCAALHYLANACGGLGVYLALTGFSLRGADLMAKGIATHFVQEENIEKFIEESKETSDLAALCERFHAQPALNSSKIFKNLEEIEEVFGKITTIEEVYDKLASKETEFRKNTLHLLSQQCPLSLKVRNMQLTLKAISKCRNKSFNQCIEMGYNLNVQTLQTNNFNFASAVHSKLIQKSKITPQWKPDHITSISQGLVNSYFTTLDIPE